MINPSRKSSADNALISVIMPCYNASKHINESIASVLQQTHHHLELIVIDDGSTDNTIDVLKQLQKDDDRITILSQSNKGPGPARNYGLRQASGEYIAFLDADDYWSHDCLEHLLEKLKVCNADLAYCGWQNVGVSGGFGDPYIPPDYNLDNKYETLLRSCPWPIHAALTKKSAIDAAGGFNESWTTSMDYDLWLRIGTSHTIVLVPEILAYYKHHDEPQITKNRLRIAMNHWAIQKQFLRQNPDIATMFSRKQIRALTDGELLHRGYSAYWNRDLHTARTIFRKVLSCGYGNFHDLKYMLPSLLPFSLHLWLLRKLESGG